MSKLNKSDMKTYWIWCKKNKIYFHYKKFLHIAKDCWDNKDTDKNKDKSKDKNKNKNKKKIKIRRSWRLLKLIWMIWKTKVVYRYRSVCKQINRSFYLTQ